MNFGPYRGCIFDPFDLNLSLIKATILLYLIRHPFSVCSKYFENNLAKIQLKYSQISILSSGTRFDFFVHLKRKETVKR